jgi:hypothetical protein
MNDLAELPRGEQTFEGVPFQIGERLIQLGGTNLPRTTTKVEGIPVNKSVARLHILHATGWGDGPPATVWEGTLIGRYVLHFEDGRIDDVPIVYGRDVRDWWVADGAQGVTRGALELRVAWKGSNAMAKQFNATIRLFLTTWINPEPDEKVLSIDYSSRKHLPTAPFCVAMTVQGKAANDVTFLDLQSRANRKLTDEFHLDVPVVAETKLARVYADEDYGVRLTAPADWARWNPAETAVPGEICRAWSPDGWTGIYLSVQKAGTAFTPQALLNARSVLALTDLRAEIHKREVRTVAGMRAAYLAYSGQGSAYGVDGRGPQRPVQHWVGIPRATDVVHVMLIAPEDNSETAEAVFEALLKTLAVTGNQTEEQKSSKEG